MSKKKTVKTSAKTLSASDFQHMVKNHLVLNAPNNIMIPVTAPDIQQHTVGLLILKNSLETSKPAIPTPNHLKKH